MTAARSRGDGRDIARELESGGATRGLAVDARCVRCKQIRAKRVPGRESVDDGPTSFRCVCHRCRRVTYWNIIRSLEGGSA